MTATLPAPISPPIAKPKQTESPHSNAPVIGAVALIIVVAVVALSASEHPSSLSDSPRPGEGFKAAPFDSATHARSVDSALGYGEKYLAEQKDPLPGRYFNTVLAPLTNAQAARLQKLTDRSGRRAQLAAIPRLRTARADYAKELESKFLDQGLDIKVSTHGENAKTLRLDYILASRVFAHQLEKTESFWGRVRELGFESVELVGYDYTNAWTP